MDLQSLGRSAWSGNSPETIMNETISKLVACQHYALEAWSNGADNVAEQIADEAWDHFERELDDAIGESLMWDLADTLKSGLLMHLAMAFDDASEKRISRHIESMSEAMQAKAGTAWKFDEVHCSMAHLGKSMRIRQRMAPRIDRYFEKGKPSMLSLMARALKNDIDYVLNDMEHDAAKDARRLRAALYEARGEVKAEIREAAATLVRRAAMAYQEALAALRQTSSIMSEGDLAEA